MLNIHVRNKLYLVIYIIRFVLHIQHQASTTNFFLCLLQSFFLPQIYVFLQDILPLIFRLCPSFRNNVPQKNPLENVTLVFFKVKVIFNGFSSQRRYPRVLLDLSFFEALRLTCYKIWAKNQCALKTNFSILNVVVKAASVFELSIPI